MRTDLEHVVEGVTAAGRKARVVVADLSDLDVLPRLVSTAMEQFGRLDIVVNNLGAEQPAAYLDTSPDDLSSAFASNVLTAHTVTAAAVPAILEHGGGSVINIASAIGHTVGRGYLASETAKAALLHYTRLAAEDLAPRIRVTMVTLGRSVGIGRLVAWSHGAEPHVAVEVPRERPVVRRGRGLRSRR